MSVEKIDKENPIIKQLEVIQNDGATITLSTINSTDDIAIKKYKIFLNGEEIATIDADNEGQLNYTYPADNTTPDYIYLPVGQKFTFSVIAIDDAKNESKAVTSAITIKDLIKPNTVNNLNVKEGANQKSTTLTWAKPYDNAGVVSYEICVIGPNGEEKTYTSKTNTITIKNLAVGEHVFTVVAIDKAGNKSSKSTDKKFNVADATAPTKGKVNLDQDSQNSIAINIDNFSDNIAIDKYEISINGVILENPSYVINDKGQLIYSYSNENLKVGEKLKVTVTAIDAVGNKSKAVTSTITIKDLINPNAVNNLNVKKGANQKSTTLTWDAASDNVGVVSYEIFVIGPNGEEKKYTSKTNSITIKNLAAGPHSYYVVAVDKAGNRSSESTDKGFDVADTTAPTNGKVNLTQDTQNSIIISTNNFSDNVDIESYKVLINGETVTFKDFDKTTDNQLICSYVDDSFAIGDKVTVTIVAVDTAGNEAKAVTSTITIKDVTKPTEVKNLGYNEGANQKSTTLTWDAANDNVGVSYEVYVDGKKYTSKTNSLTIKNLAAGLHSYYVVAVDKAGNRSENSYSAILDVKDITAPKNGKVILKQQDKDNITITLDKFSDNVAIDKYEIKVNGVTLEDPIYTINDKGQLVFTYKQADIAGKVTVSVTAIDKAGNESKAVTSTINIKDVTKPNKVDGLAIEKGSNEYSTTLTWNAASDNLGVVSYEIYVTDSNGKTKKYTSKTNSLTIKNLGIGNFKFEVYAIDKAKNTSDNSDLFDFMLRDITTSKDANGNNVMTINRGYDFDAQNYDAFEKEFAKKGNVYAQSTQSAIKGTSGNDIVDFLKGKFVYVDGDINLGDGDDTINLIGNSYKDNYTCLQAGGNINFGDGNNVFNIENAQFNCGAFLNKKFDESGNYEIKFGSGNDTININNAHEVEWGNNISLGDGDDKLTINNTHKVAVDESPQNTVIDFGSGNDLLLITGNSCLEIKNDTLEKGAKLLFGEGNDRLEISQGASILFSAQGNDNIEFDFGSGNDSLIINGCVLVGNSSNAFNKLAEAENISGNGYIIASDQVLISCADAVAKFENAGIKVYGCGNQLLTSDFDINMYAEGTAKEITEFYELSDRDIDVYLMGKAWSNDCQDIQRLLANTEDLYKFTVGNGDIEDAIWNSGVLEFEYNEGFTGGSSVSIEIQNASGETIKSISLDPNEEATYKLSSLDDGEYFIKVSLDDENANACARISIGYEY